MVARWLSPRALKLHLLAAVIVVGCVIAGWWQLHQALGGNSLSWAYTIEWPIFAVIAVIAWWHVIHEDPAEVAERAVQAEIADDWEAPPAVDAARVASAARREFESHLAKLAATDDPAVWADSKRVS